MLELKDQGKVAILVADDREYIRNLVKARLAAIEDYEVMDAPDGLKALELIEIRSPDIVLTDWLMPGIDGLGLCRRIREMKLSRYVYIILLTAKEEQIDIVAGFEAGADDYIIKPFHKAELLARVGTGARIVREQKVLRQLNELKNRFLGIAAHDMRNPLVSIRGFADVLLMDTSKFNESQAEMLQMIRSASHGMLTLVNDLLDVSVIESGRLNLGIRRASMQALLESRVKMARIQADAKNISLHLHVETMPEGYFDANRIAQVVDNLVGNAIKFSEPQTQVAVVGIRSEGGHGITVGVWDEGPGLTEADQEKLFGAFQTLSAQPTGGEKSTGLGLAITKKIIEAHGGDIEVQSRVGSGTAFIFTIPLEAKSRMEESKQKKAAKPAGRRPTVVISDDEMHIRALISTVMTSMNTDIAGMAKNGNEAIELYRRERPNLLLLDVNMPVKTGDETLQEIMLEFPDAFVIMLTSVSDIETVKKCLRLGAANYILKDTPIAEMRTIIKQTWASFIQKKKKEKSKDGEKDVKEQVRAGAV